MAESGREHDRFDRERQEAARIQARSEQAFEAWVARLADRPTESEMATWLDCDRRILMQNIFDHYHLVATVHVDGAGSDARTFELGLLEGQPITISPLDGRPGDGGAAQPGRARSGGAGPARRLPSMARSGPPELGESQALAELLLSIGVLHEHDRQVLDGISPGLALELLRTAENSMATLTTDQLRAAAKVFVHNVSIQRTHESARFPGDLLFFEATGSLESRESPQRWQEFIAGRIEVHQLPYEHGDLLGPAARPRVIQHLSDRLLHRPKQHP